jgi:hypothetical protein
MRPDTGLLELTPGTQHDDRRAEERHEGPERIPAVRASALHHP